MRKILFTVFAGAVIFLGCSKNDNNDTPATIVGTWNLDMATAATYFNNSLISTNTSNTGTIQFANDGTFSSVDSVGLHSGTYTYNSSAKTLVTISGGDTLTQNVTTLTSANLHLHYADSTSLLGNVTRIVADEDYKR